MTTAANKVAGAAPALLVGVLNWCRVLFVLNRYKGVNKLSKAEMLALLLYILSGFAAWIGEMCILDSSLAILQIVSSLYRTTLTWIGTILIVNERLLVTRQQATSFIFIVLIAFLWEVQHRIVLN